MKKRKRPYIFPGARHIISRAVDEILRLNPWEDPENADLWIHVANYMEELVTQIRSHTPNWLEGTCQKDISCAREENQIAARPGASDSADAARSPDSR
ncbi:MAG: hypothetical protein ACLQVJ_08000 [Syntrophobacteraceae bacterium]